MRDYSNMPKLEWKDDPTTLTKIKSQVAGEEPIILVMPDGFDFDFDATGCGCREESGMLTDCDAEQAFSMLAERNNIPALQQIGDAANAAGLVVDINATELYLVIHD